MISIDLFGTSHTKEMGAVIRGIPADAELDMDFIQKQLDRRKPGGTLTSERKESDIPRVEKRNPLVVVFKNEDVSDEAYDELELIPRPGHSDYTYYAKGGSFIKGGATSARLTAPMVFAGAIAKKELLKRGIDVTAKLFEAGGEKDPAKIVKAIEQVKAEGDSLGGVVECTVTGLEPGFGGVYFQKLEASISSAVFSVPAVKGLEFGKGFESAGLKGSENNDEFVFEDGRVITKTNNCGGLLGGMSDGMPLVLRAAFKPTPSIAKEQWTVNLKTGENVKISVGGRHDPCVALRGVVVIESMVALAIYDHLLAEDKLFASRSNIDFANENLLNLFLFRMEEAKKIGEFKREKGLPVTDKAREEEIIQKVREDSGDMADYAEAFFRNLIELSKKYQEHLSED